MNKLNVDEWYEQVNPVLNKGTPVIIPVNNQGKNVKLNQDWFDVKNNPDIRMVEGNILQTDCSVVAHCCNTQNTMGSGVAKALRDRFPEIYESDRGEYIKHGRNLLGKSIWVKVENSADQTQIRFVVNMYGQPNYGGDGLRYVNYEAIYQCLEELKEEMINENHTSIAMPYKLGSDRAGGQWSIIFAMIHHIFKDTNITVKLYKL